MNWTERRERFRGLLSTGLCYHPGSVFDAMSARIAEDLGFEIGMFAGSTASLTVLGAPDLIVQRGHPPLHLSRVLAPTPV